MNKYAKFGSEMFWIVGGLAASDSYQSFQKNNFYSGQVITALSLLVETDFCLEACQGEGSHANCCLFKAAAAKQVQLDG